MRAAKTTSYHTSLTRFDVRAFALEKGVGDNQMGALALKIAGLMSFPEVGLSRVECHLKAKLSIHRRRARRSFDGAVHGQQERARTGF